MVHHRVSPIAILSIAMPPLRLVLDSTSRGIGEELVRQLSADPNNVIIASCRNPEGATALKSLAQNAKGKIHIIRVDVSDESSIRAAPAEVAKILGDSAGLDYLINNAAVVSFLPIPCHRY